MTDCKCITQKIVVKRWKKKITWMDKLMYGGLLGIVYLTVHGDTMEELAERKKEIKTFYEKKHADENITVRASIEN